MPGRLRIFLCFFFLSLAPTLLAASHFASDPQGDERQKDLGQVTDIAKLNDWLKAVEGKIGKSKEALAPVIGLSVEKAKSTEKFSLQTGDAGRFLQAVRFIQDYALKIEQSCLKEPVDPAHANSLHFVQFLRAILGHLGRNTSSLGDDHTITLSEDQLKNTAWALEHFTQKKAEVFEGKKAMFSQQDEQLVKATKILTYLATRQDFSGEFDTKKVMGGTHLMRALDKLAEKGQTFCFFAVGADTTPPVVHRDTLRFTDAEGNAFTVPKGKQLTFKAGDSVHFSVKITDDKSGIGHIGYLNTKGPDDKTGFAWKTDYDPKTGIARFKLDISTHAINGEYKLTDLPTVEDKAGNTSRDTAIPEADQPRFTITGGDADTTPPVVHRDTLRFTDAEGNAFTVPKGKQLTFKAGDSVHFSVKITDDKSGIGHIGYLNTKGPDDKTGFAWKTDYDPKTGIARFKLDISTHAINGEYKLTDLPTVEDKAGNTSRDTAIPEADQPRFTITGGDADTTPPVVHRDTLRFTDAEGNAFTVPKGKQLTFKAGDSVHFSVKITDDKSGIGHIGYLNTKGPDGKTGFAWKTDYDPKTGIARFKLDISTHAIHGEYKLTDLPTVEDKAGNTSRDTAIPEADQPRFTVTNQELTPKAEPLPKIAAEDLPKRIAALIDQLGHKKYQQREAAQAQLIQIGTPAVSALQAATSDADGEISNRATAILATIRRREIDQ